MEALNLDFEIFVLLASMGVLFAALLYAWWVKARVLLLRHDLFEIRDALFDDVMRLGALDDPGYRDVRARLNTMLRIAGTINIYTMLYLIQSTEAAHWRPIQSKNVEVQKRVENAHQQLSERVFRYLILHTATGGILWIGTILMHPAAEKVGKKGVDRGLRSSVPDELPHESTMA